MAAGARAWGRAETARRATLVGVAGLAGTAAAARVVATMGTADALASAVLPGDGTTDDVVSVTTRAAMLPAPPSEVWPWLVQMGYGRAGWYAIDAVEAMVGAARSVAEDGTASWRSLHVVAPRHQHLALGDEVPLSRTAGFTVEALAPDDHLVLTLDLGAGRWVFRWVWAFVLEGTGDGRTRLIVRTTEGGRPRWLVAPLVRFLLDPGHAVMEQAQHRNLRARLTSTRTGALAP